jgi:hypothetical protein
MRDNDPRSLSNLPAYSEDGSVHAVVEAPKGSLVKLKYEVKLGAFTVAIRYHSACLILLTGDLFQVRKLRMVIRWTS